MGRLMELTGLDKWLKFFNIIKGVGGLTAAAKKRYIMDDTKTGTLVGQDKFGNKYYQNTDYFVPRDRWVEYPNSTWLDYDATQIPVEWYRWMHHTTDIPPSVNPPKLEKFALDHLENTSIYEDGKYIPYSTPREKIQGWRPGHGSRKSQL